MAMDSDYIGLGLENGVIKLVWAICQETDLEVFSGKENTPERPRTLTHLVPKAGYLADAEWHLAELRLQDENVTLTVDGSQAYFEEPGWNKNDYDHFEIFVGGIAKENSSKARELFPRNFKGCIGDIRTQEGSPISNYTDVYSENINSCQLFP